MLLVRVSATCTKSTWIIAGIEIGANTFLVFCVYCSWDEHFLKGDWLNNKILYHCSMKISVVTRNESQSNSGALRAEPHNYTK